MSKALQTDVRCPFCRKELPMKKMAIVKDVDPELREHIVNTFFTLLREGGAEDAMGFLDMIERQITNQNYKKNNGVKILYFLLNTKQKWAFASLLVVAMAPSRSLQLVARSLQPRARHPSLQEGDAILSAPSAGAQTCALATGQGRTTTPTASLAGDAFARIACRSACNTANSALTALSGMTTPSQDPGKLLTEKDLTIQMWTMSTC